MRTHDDNGRAIDALTLDTTERVLVETVGIWSGEQFAIPEVVRGTGTKERAAGWLTIKWANVATPIATMT